MSNCDYCKCVVQKESISKQLIKRRDGTDQIFCSQGCRNEYESDAEEFYRWHKK